MDEISENIGVILSGLAKLREPFKPNQISKLPKGTKKQNECPPGEKINCKVCGGWHHPQVIHLDYVGHAALTDRLLDADPTWFWEPLALKDGLPAFDGTGGLWIRLTVCGHSRIGYGNAEKSPYKEVGSREKEVIGDALRNAAMRFGAALELWHKGDLHVPENEENKDETPPPKQGLDESEEADWQLKFVECTDTETLKIEWDKCYARCVELHDRLAAERLKKAMLIRFAKLEAQP